MSLYHRPRRCDGYLMIDLLIVMTLTAVVLSTMSVWVYKTMQYSSNVDDRHGHSRNISRISKLLRSDARDAQQINIEDESVVIEFGANRVQYTIEANMIHRQASGNNRTHHDDFEFSKHAVLEWEKGDSGNVALLNIRRDFGEFSSSKKQDAMRFDSQIRISVKTEASP